MRRCRYDVPFGALLSGEQQTSRAMFLKRIGRLKLVISLCFAKRVRLPFTYQVCTVRSRTRTYVPVISTYNPRMNQSLGTTYFGGFGCLIKSWIIRLRARNFPNAPVSSQFYLMNIRSFLKESCSLTATKPSNFFPHTEECGLQFLSHITTSTFKQANIIASIISRYGLRIACKRRLQQDHINASHLLRFKQLTRERATCATHVSLVCKS